MALGFAGGGGGTGGGIARSGRRRFSRGWSRQDVVESLRSPYVASVDRCGPIIHRPTLAVNLPYGKHYGVAGTVFHERIVCIFSRFSGI